MFKVNRTGALAMILVGSLAFLPPFSNFLRHGILSVQDLFDNRPERTVLFIGNSRTFYHNMPFMVRSIADSAGFPEKLHVEMDAEPSVSLTDHMKSPDTQALLARRWDHVVLQVLSREQYSAEQAGGAWEAATEMIREVQAKGSSPAMFVTWRYTDQCTKDAGMPPRAVGLAPSGYANMHINIQQQHARLAALTGVDLVNVGLVWEGLQSQPKDFKLYDDCNHPSIYGSYLSALMFYSYFSGQDVADVSFKPIQISAEDAEMLRLVVSRYLAQNQGRSAASTDAVASN
jgi:hypothetical protein